ncbi:hypothetical protein [Algoriphagus namhaensis]
MKDQNSISTQERLPTGEDFFALKEKGMKYIQDLSGKEWTDYNEHDPGITILEQLCYGLTDVAYRCNFPIQDLLAESPKGKIDQKKNSFHSPSQVFSTHPVTLMDYRKLLIDSFEEIQNAWFTPVALPAREERLSGLYQVEIMPSLSFKRAIKKTPQVKDQLKDKIYGFLQSIRNLGEQFLEPVILSPQQVTLSVAIEIEEDVNPERIFSLLLFALEKYLYQPVAYSNLEELLSEKETMQEVFSGPRLKGGLIKNSELKAKVNRLHPESFQRIFARVPGVKKVTELSINGKQGTEAFTVEPGCFATLSTKENDPESIYRTMVLRVNRMRQSIHRDSVDRRVSELWSKNYRQFQFDRLRESHFEEKLQGKFRFLARYTSICNHFPSIYGLGKEGLPSYASVEIKAKVKQLKGYLLLMEQLMANALAQLAAFTQFIDPAESRSEITYFAQQVSSLDPMVSLVRTLEEDDQKAKSTQEFSFSGEKESDFFDRKNRILDHFLARFGENLDPVPFRLARKVNLIPSQSALQRVLIEAKASLLAKIDDFNYYKAKGQNHKAHNRHALSGLERAIYTFSGIRYTTDLLCHQLSANALVDTAGQKESVILDDEKALYAQFQPLAATEWEEIVASSTSDYLIFQNIEIKQLFRDTLDQKSYLISKKKDNQGLWQLLFKKSDTTWEIIWEGKSRKDGIERLSATIDRIREMNAVSEGFYLLDHILLQEILEDSEFGFQLYDSEGRATFTSPFFLSENERAEALEEFYTAVSNGIRYEPGMSEIKILGSDGSLVASCNLMAFEPGEVHQLIADTVETAMLMAGSSFEQGYFALRQVENIRLQGTFMKTRPCKQLRVVCKRRLGTGEIVGEDFFNLAATLVLPDWPARFQEKQFKSFLKELVQQRVPSHIKVQIHWLDFMDFGEFEGLYFDWKSLQKKGADQTSRKEVALKLYQNIKRLEDSER